MSEISYYDADLQDILQDIEETVGKLEKAKGKERRTEHIATAERKLNEAKDLRNGFNLAMRQLSDRLEQKKYRQKLSQHVSKFEQLERSILWSKTNSASYNSGQYGGGAVSGGGNQQALAQALTIQDKAKTSLTNTQRMIETSKDIAQATNERLEEQTQQIGQITDDVIRIDDTLTRADKLIRTFSRRMATDRVILFFAFLIFVAIAGIIIYSALNPDQTEFYVPDEVKPPSPKDLGSNQ